MQPIKPLKRSFQLAPLSREHHETLLVVWKIRQGIKYQTDPSIIISYCKWFWNNNLDDHFSKEEEGLVPILGLDHPMIGRMLAEHVAIKTEINNLESSASYPTLESLAQKITDHVRFEERELFPLIEQTANLDQLQLFLDQEKGKDENSSWENEFWMKKSQE